MPNANINRKILFGANQQALFLQLFPNARAAYSIARKLNPNYTGACFRVRRSSDSTETDIGFSNNSMDAAGLLSFCGAGDGFVVSIYDQSDNGLTLSQSTAGFQPKIVASGVVITNSGKPSMYFLDNVRALTGSVVADWKFLNYGFSTSTYIVAQFGIIANPTVNYPVLGTNNATSANHGMHVAYSDSVNNDKLIHLVSNASGSPATAPIENSSANGALTPNTLHVISVLDDATNASLADRSEIRIDGGTVIKNNTSNGTTNNTNPAFPLMLGGYGSTKGFIGYVSEVIFYPVKQSATNNFLIENNLLSYY